MEGHGVSILSPREMLRSKSLPHVIDLKRAKLLREESIISEDASSGFQERPLKELMREDSNLSMDSSSDAQEKPSVKLKSSPSRFRDKVKMRLMKQHSNISNDSTSGFKDSGIEEHMDGPLDIQADFPSLPSSGDMQPDYPSNGSGINPSVHSVCTCDDEHHNRQPDQVKVIISKNTVIVAPFDHKLKEFRTLKQHYYPEGGWGWVIVITAVLVHTIIHGVQIGLAILFINHLGRIPNNSKTGSWNPNTGWLGALSTSVSLFISPITIAFCRRKSTRLTAVMGGLVTALGCLFTSFAGQFHQLFFSYGAVVGVGVGLTRDTSTLMVGQYFKRRRDLVEILLVSGSGLGLSSMSLFIKSAIRELGWRIGLQAVTGVVFTTFILGMFYRSATLYHPQRRAILHLKNQKRKIKDKNKTQEEKPPFFDFSCLKSRTVQILLVSTGLGAVGINTPLFYLAHQATEEGLLENQVILLQTYLGLAWVAGCFLFGILVVQKSTDCRIGRQYLCQAAILICGMCILALTSVEGYNAYVIFVWVYGVFLGGYHYSLKMYVYEKVRARNFARAWGFIQFSQSIPNGLGIPISGYINVGCGGTKAGYYFSATCVLLGSFTLFLIDFHKRRLRKKHARKHRKLHGVESEACSEHVSENLQHPLVERKISFPEEEYNMNQPIHFLASQNSLDDLLDLKKPELTCISEEGIADMDLPDNILDELDYLDNITSCNKVENCLMLSEYEQNLIKETEGPLVGRKGRKWSLVRQPSSLFQGGMLEPVTEGVAVNHTFRPSPLPLIDRRKSLHRELPAFRSGPWKLLPGANRSITTIDEASV